MNILELYPYLYNSLKCWKLEPNKQFYYSNQTTKGILRFTSFVNEGYYCCENDSDLLQSFSKYANLKLIFNETKYKNDSLPIFLNNETDYLYEPEKITYDNYDYVGLFPVLRDDFKVNFAMRKQVKETTTMIDELDFSILILIIISYLITSSFGPIREIIRQNKCFNKSFVFSLILNSIYNSGFSNKKSNFLFIITWVFSFLIISELFKIVIFSNLLNKPKFWFESIEQLSDSRYNYFIMNNSVTHKLIIENSKDNKYWTKISEKAHKLSWDEILGAEKFYDFLDGKIGFIDSSTRLQKIESLTSSMEMEKEFSFYDIKYNKISEIRLVNKKYQYAGEVIKIAQVLVEGGLTIHFDRIKQFILPLLVRSMDLLDSSRFVSVWKFEIKLQNLLSTIYFTIISWIISSFIIIVEIVSKDFS